MSAGFLPSDIVALIHDHPIASTFSAAGVYAIAKETVRYTAQFIKLCFREHGKVYQAFCDWRCRCAKAKREMQREIEEGDFQTR